MAAEVVADLEAGVLRLSRPALRLLAAVAGEQQAPPEAEPGLFDALQEAGLVTPVGLHPSVAPLAAAVARPVVHVRFDHLGPGTPVECPGWIDPHVAVLAVPDEEGLHDILAVPTSFFPARLAALVGLGPRPRPPVSGSLSTRASSRASSPGWCPGWTTSVATSAPPSRKRRPRRS